MKILLFAANPRVRQKLCDLLADRAHQVAVAEDADAACAACRGEAFELVLFDADSQPDRGTELCGRLRALLPAQSMLLALGVGGRPEELAGLLAAGVDDLLAEPEDPQQSAARLAVIEHRLAESETIARDIAEWKGSAEERRRCEHKLNCLFENLPDFVIAVDQNANIECVNHGVPGISPDELVGANGFGFVAPEYRQPCRDALERVCAAGKPGAIEVLDMFGTWWSCRLVPIIEDGNFDNVMVICADVTGEKRAAEAMRKERRLLRRLLDLHERDRKLMAYEVHDGFAQQLTGALFNFETLGQIQPPHGPRARKTFDTGIQLLTKSISETRRLISGLRPPILDESGIVAAVDYLVCEAEERGGPKIEFFHDVRFDRLAPPLEGAIFRIIQESLANSCRHSQSDRIRIEIVHDNRHVRVEVRDWGIGFDPEKVEPAHFGLQGVHERARLLGGSVTIETAAGQGTCITVELPLIENADQLEDP